MNRRNFFIKSSILGGAISCFPSCSIESVSNEKKTSTEQEIAIEKVTRAMLTMQRASWEQGVAAQALLELGNDELVYLMAKEAILRQQKDGRLSVVYTDNGVTDPACSGEPVLYTYQRTGEEEFKQASDKMLEWLLEKAPRSKSGIIYHTLNAPTIWVDSFYMSPPFLAFAGKYSEAVAQLEGMRNILWNNEYKLFSHQWHDGEQRFLSQRFWGTGEGWAAASFARLLKTLPDSMMQEKQKISAYLKDLLDGCLKFMREDGLFHNYINESDTFIETNCSQMLAYSIFSSVKDDWLDKDYLKYANRMRDAAYAKIDNNGYVMGVAGAPTFQKYGRSTEGQAFFLLMEAAYNKLDN